MSEVVCNNCGEECEPWRVMSRRYMIGERKWRRYRLGYCEQCAKDLANISNRAFPNYEFEARP